MSRALLREADRLRAGELVWVWEDWASEGLDGGAWRLTCSGISVPHVCYGLTPFGALSELVRFIWRLR